MLAAAWAAPGCAIHYYDKATDTEHIWGFGHMAVKRGEPVDGVRAVVRGTDTLGVALGSLGEEGGYAVIGWQSIRRLYIVAEEQTIGFAWPTSSFFSVRVGGAFPHATPGTGASEQQIETHADPGER